MLSEGIYLRALVCVMQVYVVMVLLSGMAPLSSLSSSRRRRRPRALGLRHRLLHQSKSFNLMLGAAPGWHPAGQWFADGHEALRELHPSRDQQRQTSQSSLREEHGTGRLVKCMCFNAD